MYPNINLEKLEKRGRNMMNNIKNVEAKAFEQIKKNKAKAKKVIESPDKFDLLISETYKVAEKIPCIGNMLSKILVMISMTKDYIDGTYDKPPVSAILAIVASLIYLVSVVDLIPDAIPGIGYIDDVAVLSACWKIINIEIDQYMIWKNIEL